MGSEESIEKRMIEYQNHERMGIHKHIESEEQYYVEVVRELSNEGIYKEWKARVADIKQGLVGADIVYLPISHSYNKTEVCGSGGILTVFVRQCRCCSNLGKVSSKKKSKVDEKTSIAILKRKYGSYSSVS